MRRTLGLLVLLSFAANSGAADPTDAGAQVQEGTIEVEVQNLVGVQGTMLMSLHNSSDTFPGKAMQAWRKERVPVTQNPFLYTFEHVPYGEYAVGAAHDENGNGKTDTGIFGIPIEGLGVSNNPFSIGPPSFSSAKFKLATKTLKLTIKIRR